MVKRQLCHWRNKKQANLMVKRQLSSQRRINTSKVDGKAPTFRSALAGRIF
jgi:hypothetical protein